MDPLYRVLVQVSRFIQEVYEPDTCYIKIKLDGDRIRLLKASGTWIVCKLVLMI